jgi:2-polyprenyl-3-methyl-5-hydroxy-6-metoxy-1,4-benzoquinol methylase
MPKAKTREPQYQVCVDLIEQGKMARLGLMSNHTWHEDPKRLLFVLSRYKFVAKMLAGYDKVLEVGCADAFGSRIVRQHVEVLIVTDFDPVMVEDARARQDEPFTYRCEVHDMLEDGPMDSSFDAAYALDVLEHIKPEKERRFLRNIAQSLNREGVLIIGVPSVQSQVYASGPSREGHVNCKDYKGLKQTMQEFFRNVFIFSMNDEVVHTGFAPMASYLFALCCGRHE